MPTGIYIRNKKLLENLTERVKPYCFKIGHRNYNIKHTEERKKKIIEALKYQWKNGTRKVKTGKNSPNWKGGINPENLKIRKSIECQNWRKNIFERDNFTCQVCRKVGGNLQAHHIKSFSKYPELRFVIENGITLCKECHKKTDDYLKHTKKDLKI